MWQRFTEISSSMIYFLIAITAMANQDQSKNWEFNPRHHHGQQVQNTCSLPGCALTKFEARMEPVCKPGNLNLGCTLLGWLNYCAFKHPPQTLNFNGKAMSNRRSKTNSKHFSMLLIPRSWSKLSWYQRFS